MLSDSHENLNNALDRIFEILKEHDLMGVVVLSDGTENSCRMVKMDAANSLIEYDGVSDEGHPLYLFDTREGTTAGEFQADANATLNAFSGIAAGMSSTLEMLVAMQNSFVDFIQTVANRVKFKHELHNFSKNNQN